MISSEIRYFFEPGILPRQKLIDTLELQPEPARTDHYCLFEKAFSTGVKLREGRLEVKSLIGQVREGGILLSHWEKITVENKGAGLSANSLPIRKNRWTVYLDRNFRKIPPGEGLTCQVEYCQLSIGQQNLESLCLEASGGAQEDRKDLVLNLHQNWVRKLPELNVLLRDKNRKSYPELLLKLYARKAR